MEKRDYYEVLGVGQYTVQGDATQPNSNYNITVLSGSLNIVKAEIFAVFKIFAFAPYAVY